MWDIILLNVEIDMELSPSFHKKRKAKCRNIQQIYWNKSMAFNKSHAFYFGKVYLVLLARERVQGE